MMTEELKEKMRLGREKAKELKNKPLLEQMEKGNGDVEIKSENVVPEVAETIREEFNIFRENTKKTNEQIFGLLEQLLNKDKTIGQTLEKEVVEENNNVPVEDEIQDLNGKQLAVFEKYFDKEDGFKGWYNVNSNIFTIEVPMKLSNTTESHRVLYKQDLRSRKVDQNNVLSSIETWCRLVCQNIKYNKQFKLK